MQVLRTLSPLARWIVIGCIATLCVLGAFAIIFVIKFPFKESSVVQILQRQSSGVVHIAGFKRVYFPPGFVADGVIITLPGVQGPPLINVGHAKVTATYAGLLAKPQRISSLRLEHFIVHIPESAPATKQTNKNSGDDVIIEHVNADHARLEFGNDAVFNIHHLALSNVATTRRITFETNLSIPEPPGDITAQGTFGPWHGGRTPVAGKYQFRHANLGSFKGLGGFLASDGTFSGPLYAITTEGWTDVPDFEANNSGHREQLRTRFHARVDATKGNVFLDKVDASFGQTDVISTGKVENNKGASLQIDIPRARIEDFLHMMLEARTPGMFGSFNARLTAQLPAGDRQFVRKLRLLGDFGIDRASFGSPETQQGIDKLSQRAQGEKQNEDPARVFSNLKGHVELRDGIAHLSNISFTVPGALVRLHGTYDLPREYVHLDGTLHMEATLSQATHGIASFLLKPLNRLFRKKNRAEGSELPIHIVGPYSNTQVHIDPVPAKLAHPDRDEKRATGQTP